MEKNIEICLLLDFYGQLLTPRQEEIMNMYYNNDLSLGEIAENLGITRQGVHDNIRRSENTLIEMEERLSLVKKFKDNKAKVKTVLERISFLGDELSEKRYESANNEINKIKNILNSIIDD
ncbi:MAG: YlxM family DNA-binding protein [Ignavibacteriales bacterium]